MRFGSRSVAVTPLGVLLTIGGVLSGLLAFIGLVLLIWGLIDGETGVELGRTALGMLFFTLLNVACVVLDRRRFNRS